MTTKRWLISTLLLAAVAAQAQEPKDAVDALRQRLAERLATPGEGKATVKPAAPAVSRGAPKGTRAETAKGHGAASTNANAKPERWGYTGDVGPEHWASLAPENKPCGVGTRQSPIDIRDGIAVDLEKIAFDYRPSPFSVLDNGRTVQVDVAPGNGLTVMGKRYELVRMDFHRPSEERINGRQFDMSVHLLHKDAQGRVAIVAVLLDRGPDNQPQPLIQTLWGNLPLERGEALAAQVPLDLNQLLPADRGYYTYMGSLTTPPCSEGVLWMVMRQPVLLTTQQVDVFSRLYPMNARPLQAGSGRLIKQSQ